jgi:putative inorganic carbon (HCO3(-)) transporter
VSGLLIVTLIKVIYLKKIKINKNIFKHILWPSIYILVLIISTFFAFDINKAIFGSYTRQFSLLTQLFLYLWFILLLFHLSIKPRLIKINEIYKTIALSALLVSIYATLQYFGIDFVQWNEAAINTKRAFSTLGQPNYLGLFIVMVIPIIFYLFKIEKNKYLRYLWLLSILFSILAWFFTGSRSAWLGLLSIVFISIFYFLIKKKNLIKLKPLIIGILIVVVFFTALFSSTFFRERFSSSFDINKGSAAIRLMYWESAYDKIIKSPIIGYGPGQQKDVLRDTYTKEWAVYEKLNTYTDRAHNIILDYLLIGGLLLLFAYIMMLRSWFLQGRKALKTNNYQVVILMLSLIAYLIVLLFSFEVIVTSFYFWLFGALIIVGSNKDEKSNYTVFNLNFSKAVKKLLIFFLLLIYLLFLYFQLQKIIANHYFLASKQASAKGVYNESLLLYNYSKATGFSHEHYDLYFADSIAYLLIENKQKPYRELELKLEEIANSLELSSYDNIFIKARINSALGKYDKAEKYYLQAINFAPEIVKTYQALADNYFLERKYDTALKYYDISIEKIPNINNQKINNEHREQLKKYLSFIWEKKGDVYYNQGKYDKAIIAFQKAYNYNLYQVPLLKKIADSYYLKDNIEMAIFYNKKGKQRNPDDLVWSTALAWLYYQQGNTEEAKIELKEVLNISKDYKPALDLKKEFNFNF